MDALLSPVLAPSPNQDRLTPRTAKLIKGSLWSLFAASAATAIGLGIANQTSAGVISENGGRVEDALARPAFALAGVSAAILAVTIPITYFVHRAEKNQRTSEGTVSSPLLRCPQ